MLLFVYGGDQLRVKERAEDLKKKFLEKYDPAQMNTDDIVFKGDSDIATILHVTQAAPFLSERRMVIVRGMVEALKKTEAKAWVEGLSRTPSSTVLVFVDTIDEPEFEKKELWKGLSGLQDVHRYPLKALQGAELLSWAKERVLKLGVVITPSLLQDLFTLTRENPWRIDAELQKLAAYARGEQVTSQMLNLLVRPDVEANIFGFMDALASGSGSKALPKLAEERESGTDEFQLFGMLSRQLRLLIQARAVLETKPSATKQDIATAIGAHPFVAQKLLSEVKKWSPEKLARTHQLAEDMDKGMKSGLPPRVAVDRFIAEWLVT